MEKKKYSIGLDIGTESVGWAVINPDTFEVLKGKVSLRKYNLQTGEVSKSRNTKKPLWGVELFNGANTAEERRTYRNVKRRYDRRRKRIKLLQDIFKEEITKVDADFFNKLKTSFYSPQDKNHYKYYLSESDKRDIFSNNKRDRNNKEDKIYPTIYHLRKELIENPEKKDIRLVYLAIHHIIKYRGNFLYQNDNFSVNNLDIQGKLKEIFESYNELVANIPIDDINYETIEKAIFSDNKKDMEVLLKENFKDILGTVKSNEIIKLIKGNEFNVLKLFDIEKEENFIEKTSFSGSKYDDEEDTLLKQLGDKFDVLSLFKKLYDMVFLKKLFKGSNETSISNLRVEYYNSHKEDLKELKQVLKENKKEYKRILENPPKEYNDSDIKKDKNKKEKDKNENKLDFIYYKYTHNKIDYEELKKELEKTFKNLSESELLNKIKEKLEKGDFLPRITSTDNGKYPYQFNKDELRKIIENQGKYYPFLLEKVNGVYKIEKILSFKIPYYVGPLNNQTRDKDVKNPNAWLIRNDGYENIAINPFNFEEIVNKEATAREFIERMVGKCTYINNEKALALNSIFYSRFKVYNELKQISIGERKISKNDIDSIYNGLFLKKAKVTQKDLEDFYYVNGKQNMGEIKGFQKDKEFASNMKSYIDFFGDNGIFVGTSYTEEDAEQIIEDITIFEDKELLRNKIVREYPELSEKQVNKICTLKYKGWSSLSKKLLNEVYYIEELSHERKSIMDLMLETSDNFMQIISSKKYDFQGKINKLNKIDTSQEISYELVKNLATSPKNKRGIYQALLIVQEIVELMGCEPEAISIEMARGEEEKKRTDSRKDYLNKIYKDIKDQVNKVELDKLQKELNNLEDNDLKAEKIFLYFIQLGRCLYTGEKLSIDSLDKDCEVDHIIPRTLIKDNSFDNKALVLRIANQKKKDSLVVPEEFRRKQMSTWGYLKDKKLISNKKYFSLIRPKFSEDQIKGFINRQLVETRQISKHVANILQSYYQDTKIIYLNADLSHSYREKFNLYKFRELNDYHHAHDAYLAACLGTYKDKYLDENLNLEKLKELTNKYFENKEYSKLKYGYVINSLDNSLEDSLNVSLDDSIVYTNKYGENRINNIRFNKKIEENLYRNDIIVTKKTEYKTGKLFDETKYKKGNNGVELKKGFSTELYGFYSSVKPAYAVIVIYEENEEINQRIITVPIYCDLSNDNEMTSNYLKKVLNLDDKTELLYKRDLNGDILKIPFNSKLVYKEVLKDGKILIKRGSLIGCTATGIEVCNSTEFKIEKEKMKKWKSTLRYLLNNKKDGEWNEEKYEKEIDNILCYIYEYVGNKYDIFNSSLPKIKKAIELCNELDKKEKLIKELLRMTKYNSDNADLSFIKETVEKEGKKTEKSLSTELGRQKNKTISHGEIIIQSPTGVKTKIYEF